MADMKISELSSVASLNNGDLIEVSQVDSSSPTGYSSMKASMLDVGNKVNKNIQYTQDLETISKTIIGAVNEVVSTKQDKITTTVGTAKTFTSSTAYNYTGVSISCPAGHTYLVQTRFNYSNSEPLEVGVGTATNNTNNYAMIAHTTQTNTVQFLIAGGYTFYYYAKYSGANTNSLTETIIDITT